MLSSLGNRVSLMTKQKNVTRRRMHTERDLKQAKSEGVFVRRMKKSNQLKSTSNVESDNSSWYQYSSKAGASTTQSFHEKYFEAKLESISIIAGGYVYLTSKHWIFHLNVL